MNQLNKNNRGFSLVEIIVVIAIMSIMAGVVGYGFSLTNGKPAEECARKLSAAISHGRTAALGKYRNTITVRKESDGRLTVTEDTLVDVKDDGTQVWTSRSSTVGKGVEVRYKTQNTGYNPLGDGEALQIWYDSGSGALKEKLKKGAISNIDAASHELSTTESVDYCTGFEISRAGKVWYVKLETHTGRVTSSTTDT